MQGLILLLFAAVILGLCLASLALYEYYSIASSLPSVSDLQQRTSQFETTRILDRNGNLLYEIVDPNAGRRTYVPLERSPRAWWRPPSPPKTRTSTATRAMTCSPSCARCGRTTSAARRSPAPPPSRSSWRAPSCSARRSAAQRTYLRKAREIILAAEITRRYSRDEILEIYLNEIYYGNLAYGIEAAAETYFGTSAENLTLAQAAFLAGLPQSPVGLRHPHQPRCDPGARSAGAGPDAGGQHRAGLHPVSNSDQPVCVDAPIGRAGARWRSRDYNFPSPNFNMRYPHWVNYVRSQLELQPNYDAQTIYRAGLTVQTTLDPVLQEQAQQLVTAQVAALAANNAHDGALVAIKPSTGEILAMVGSADYYNEAISGPGQHGGQRRRASRVRPSSRSTTWRPSRRAGRRPR